METEKKQVNVRMHEDTKKKFDAVAAEFGNQQAAMEAIVNAYSIDKAKQTLPGNADVINDVQAHLRAIERSFIANYDYIANSDNRIRTEFTDKIERLEAENGALVKQISNLTEALQSETQRADAADQALANSKAIMQTAADLHDAHDILIAENEELKEKVRQLEELRNQLTEMTNEKVHLESELKALEARTSMLFMALSNKKSGEKSKEQLMVEINAETNEQMTEKLRELKSNEKNT